MRAIVIALCLVAPAAHAEDASVTAEAPAPPTTDVRLTLSTFLYRETGDQGPPLVNMGAEVSSASPIPRYFGDLRTELTDGGFQLDARVRQTTAEPTQSGASGANEYEIRTLRLRVGSASTGFIVGRQYIDAVGATKIDGLAFERKLSTTWTTTLFAGAFPQLGSRSLATDYPAIVNADGTEGTNIIPLTGGVGVTYSKPMAFGSLGAAAVYVPESVPNATTEEASRVFMTANGYARPTSKLDVYHFVLVDVAGNAGVNVTNGSLGVTAHASPNLQLSTQLNHVSTDLLQIAARNTLEDPDPTAIGVVQNNIAIVRVSQDLLRGGASYALVKQRFEVSGSAGLRRRPALDVPLADGSSVAFPDAKSLDLTMGITDRHSVADLRVSASATLTYPLSDVGNRSRGAIARIAGGRAFAQDRAEVLVDVMAERFRDLGGNGMCSTSTDVFACYGAATTAAAQAGVLGSWKVAREWLLLLDAHVGARSVDSVSLSGPVHYPTAYSVTAFARAQWHYR